MDGEHIGDVLEGGIFGVKGAQHHGHKSRLPVVAVEDLRNAEDLRSLDHGTGKHGEALGVVGIIAGGRSVKRVTIEVERVFDEIVGYAVRARPSDDGAEAVLVVVRNGDTTYDGARIGELGLPVAGQIDRDLVA